MRLEMKRDAELAKRKGQTVRFVLATIWLAFCFGVAYLVSEFLLQGDYLSMDFFYTYLFIPRTVDEIYVRIGFMIVIVVIMQFFVLIAYALASPIGRKHPGTPTLESPNPDPNASKYDYR
jgi:hypothetical protein